MLWIADAVLEFKNNENTVFTTSSVILTLAYENCWLRALQKIVHEKHAQKDFSLYKNWKNAKKSKTRIIKSWREYKQWKRTVVRKMKILQMNVTLNFMVRWVIILLGVVTIELCRLCLLFIYVSVYILILIN